MLDHEVTEIKKLLLANELTQKQIGERFGVSRSLVSDIATGRVHRDVEPVLRNRKVAGGQPSNRNLESQNVALIGQLANTRDERNMLKRQLKAASKRIAVVDGIVEQLSPIITPIKPCKPVKLPKIEGKAIDETLVLMLSDSHCDQVITPEEVDGLEDFDFPVAARRAEVLVEELLKFALVSLKGFRFRKLVILGLGDYTGGDIHGAANRSYFGCSFTNDLAIAQLFAQMFRELAAHFETVEILSVVGNHGRLTDKIEFHKESVSANHDTLIMKIAEVHCAMVPNITFEFPAGLSTIKEINGWNFFCHHGHGKKGSAETWARAKRKSQTIVPLHKGAVHYFCSGHFHTEGQVTVSGGATMLGNGAWPGCDQYSYQNIDEAGTPSQTIFGVHKRNGVTWRLPIQLRTDGEKAGPQRYQIMEKQ
jgi:transcriptional regulator with XRE-family HTH domain